MKLGAKMSMKAEQDKRFNEFEHDCQSEVEGLNARIAQLEEALAVADKYIPVNLDCISISTRAEIKLINKALATSSDTWLAEHDREVEVKVLETAMSTIHSGVGRPAIDGKTDDSGKYSAIGILRTMYDNGNLSAIKILRTLVENRRVE